MLTATFFAFTCFCMLSDPYCTTFNMHAAMLKTQSNVFNLEDGVAEGETTTIQDPALQKLDESLNGVITEFISTAEFSGKAVRTPLSDFVCNPTSAHYCCCWQSISLSVLFVARLVACVSTGCLCKCLAAGHFSNCHKTGLSFHTQ